MTTTPAAPAASQQAAIDAALLVLKSMGVSLEDLTAPSNRRPVPTFAEYVPVVAATVTPGHTDGREDRVSVTSTYVRATLAEVATALSALTGEPHPLAAWRWSV